MPAALTLGPQNPQAQSRLKWQWLAGMMSGGWKALVCDSQGRFLDVEAVMLSLCR